MKNILLLIVTLLFVSCNDPEIYLHGPSGLEIIGKELYNSGACKYKVKAFIDPDKKHRRVFYILDKCYKYDIGYTIQLQ